LRYSRKGSIAPAVGWKRRGSMTVRFVPGTRKQKSSLIEGFLSKYHVDHELVSAEQLSGSKTFHLGTDPAVEIDGRLFVDPNVDALKKIFHID
jgi:hypothetical protein